MVIGSQGEVEIAMPDFLDRYSDVNSYYLVSSQNTQVRRIDSITESIINIIGTTPGERLFFPEFGSQIQSLLFEQMNEETASRILDELIDAIQFWEPRVRVSYNESSVLPDYDNNTYYARVSYRLVEGNGQGEFTAAIAV